MTPLSVKINTMALVCIPPVDLVFLIPSNVTWTLEQTPDFIFTGMSLQTFQCNTEENVTELGSKLFTRLVSGTRCSIRPLSKQHSLWNFFLIFFKISSHIYDNSKQMKLKGVYLYCLIFVRANYFKTTPFLCSCNGRYLSQILPMSKKYGVTLTQGHSFIFRLHFS